jgi:hypothetical protein
VAAILVGGTTNVINNWDHIKDQEKGHGHQFLAGLEYFGVGALAGEAALYGGPIAGIAVGGLANAGLDEARGNFDNPEEKYTVWQSFTRGALSGLAGGEAAAEARETLTIAERVSYSASDGFSEFITTGNPYLKALYFGTKNVAAEYGENRFSGAKNGYSNNRDVAVGIASKFAGGFLGSLIGDAGEDFLKTKGPNFGKNSLNYTFPKVGGKYIESSVGGIIEDVTTQGLTNQLSFNSFAQSTASHFLIYNKNNQRELIPDGLLILYLGILKAR